MRGQGKKFRHAAGGGVTGNGKVAKMLSTVRFCTRSRVGVLPTQVRHYAMNKKEDKMRYGFVGLGKMGYPMAFNLLRKAAVKSTMTIFDVNPESTARFKEEAAKIPNAPSVYVAKSPRDVAERAVCPRSPPDLPS